jgi:hypothetical protein
MIVLIALIPILIVAFIGALSDSLGRRPVIVLNRLGMRGALTRRKVEEALKMKIDVVMPDLPRSIQLAATMGEAAAAS